MFFLLRFFLALLIAGQALLRWPHWNPRYSRMFVERRQEPLPFPAKLIRGEVAEAGVRLRPLQGAGVDFGASIRHPKRRPTPPEPTGIWHAPSAYPQSRSRKAGWSNRDGITPKLYSQNQYLRGRDLTFRRIESTVLRRCRVLAQVPDAQARAGLRTRSSSREGKSRKTMHRP